MCTLKRPLVMQRVTLLMLSNSNQHLCPPSEPTRILHFCCLLPSALCDVTKGTDNSPTLTTPPTRSPNMWKVQQSTSCFEDCKHRANCEFPTDLLNIYIFFVIFCIVNHPLVTAKKTTNAAPRSVWKVQQNIFFLPPEIY